MKLLLLETSFESCVVGLAVDGQLLERSTLARQAHARLLLPWAEELLAEAQLGLGQLDAIAFGRGPGGFTSLRIGISAVQGLAFGAGLGVVPVSSLQCVAQAVAGAGSSVLVAMDARMDEVFAARFERREGIMRPAGDERVCAPETAAQLAQPGDCGVGNGFSRYPRLRETPGLASVQADAWPSAAALWRLAEDWLATRQALPPEQAQPVYLRDKVAQTSAERAAGVPSD